MKMFYGSGTKNLIISNKEIKDIMEIVKVLVDSNILLKGVTNTTKNEIKDQKRGFLGILLGPLGVSVFESWFWE